LPIVPRECCSLDIGTARAAGVNMLAVIGSLLVTSQLIGVYRAPVDPVTLPAPVTGQWYVVQGGRAELVNVTAPHASEQRIRQLVRVAPRTTGTTDSSWRHSDYCTIGGVKNSLQRRRQLSSTPVSSGYGSLRRIGSTTVWRGRWAASGWSIGQRS
jgi:hypothetical protein